MAGDEEDDNIGSDTKRHPFERAKAALQAAREARGATEEEEEILPSFDRSDPLSRAQAALDAARDARESGGRIQREREARAKAELDQLKALSGIPGADPSAEPPKGGDDLKPAPPAPRKRDL